MSYLNINRFYAILSVALLLLLQGCSNQTLRVVPHTELKVFDPIWTTAYITRNHGYLVYDTLFSMNENMEPQPQMVDTSVLSEDKKTWTFKLRDGLKWHDGTNVTAEDCVASLKRWGVRDGEGQLLFKNIESLTAPDEKTIVMKLVVPNRFVLSVLAKLSPNVPFMMPKRIAETDPFTEIKDPIGSGPFIFQKDEWIPGKQVVYVRNENYVPRTDPTSLAAGSKKPKLERIVWEFYPDKEAAAEALLNGKVDYVESIPTKLLPKFEEKKDIVIALTGPVGNVAMARFNSSIPPFNNVEIRRAVIMAMDQKDYMSSALGDQEYWKTCYSVFPCGTEFETDVGNSLMKVGDLETAEKALKKAHYDGTPVIILNPTDVPIISAFTQVTVDKLHEIGMKVEVQDMTWAELIERRANRGSVADGGWNMFHTYWIAEDLNSPMGLAFSGNSVTGWFGWPTDQKLEEYRAEYLKAESSEEAHALADKIQTRLFDIGAFALLGQFVEPIAYKSKVHGVTAPIPFFGNMSFEKNK